MQVAKPDDEFTLLDWEQVYFKYEEPGLIPTVQLEYNALGHQVWNVDVNYNCDSTVSDCSAPNTLVSGPEMRQKYVTEVYDYKASVSGGSCRLDSVVCGGSSSTYR